jgi:hypothetical protein
VKPQRAGGVAYQRDAPFGERRAQRVGDGRG